MLTFSTFHALDLAGIIAGEPIMSQYIPPCMHVASYIETFRVHPAPIEPLQIDGVLPAQTSGNIFSWTSIKLKANATAALATVSVQ
jgi:hypothetical protein